MVVYWVLFVAPALLSILHGTSSSRGAKSLFGWGTVWCALVIVIGLRYEVGGDWINYLDYFEQARGASVEELLSDREPFFASLVAGVAELGGSMIWVNFVCAMVFVTGLLMFCRDQPRPWLALTVATPYLVIVVAMGYTRQAVAIGCILAGLTFLAERRAMPFVLCVLAGALFHRTAVIVIPLAALAEGRGRWWTIAWTLVTAAAAYSALLAGGVDGYRENYVVAQYDSAGAGMRIGMNIVPTLALLLFRKRILWRSAAERNLWVLIGIASVGAGAALFVSPSSTAVDRLALYLIPMQMFVFSRLPGWVVRRSGYLPWVVIVVLYYAAIQYTWLVYAVHASAWLPYQSAIFAD